MLILLGDFAYADNWLNFSQPVSSQQWSTVSCEAGGQGCRVEGGGMWQDWCGFVVIRLSGDSPDNLIRRLWHLTRSQGTVK